jgi:hypothetical protein
MSAVMRSALAKGVEVERWVWLYWEDQRPCADCDSYCPMERQRCGSVRKRKSDQEAN